MSDSSQVAGTIRTAFEGHEGADFLAAPSLLTGSHLQEFTGLGLL